MQKWFMRRTLGRRVAAMALSVCMVFTLFPTMAFGEETGYLCGHVHDEECGYREAVEGAPCSHENEDSTYGCAPIVDEDATPSDADEDYACDHTDGCGYAEGAEGAECTHSCELCSPQEQDNPVGQNDADGQNNMTGQADTVPKPAGTPEKAEAVIRITGFEPLDEKTQNRLVPVGTEWADLELPEKLKASGYAAEDADIEPLPEALTVKDITWEIDPDNELNEGNSLYSPEIGSYCLTPVLPEGYELESGVELPEIYVMIDGQLAKLADFPVYIGDKGYPTLKEAFDAATSTDPQNPTVIEVAKNLDITKSIAPSADKCIELTSQGNSTYTLTRGAAFSGSDSHLFALTGGTMVLENIILDGRKEDVSSVGNLVNVQDANLDIREGAVLQNNNDSAVKLVVTSGETTVTLNGGKISGNTADSGAAVSFRNSGNMKFVMNDGEISDNVAKRNGGAITEAGYTADAVIEINDGKITGNMANGTSDDSPMGGAIYSNGTLLITGGEITGNSAPNGRGGGIYKAGGTNRIFTMTGGTVSGNTARPETVSGGSGANVYVARSVFTIGGAVNIPDSLLLNLESGYVAFYICSALEHNIEFENFYDNPSKGKLVAAGAVDQPYSITENDLAKFSYKGGAYGFALDKENNQIKLANPSYSVSYTLTGVEREEGKPLQTSVEKGERLSMKFVALSGYKLPAVEVTVKVGGTELVATRDYQLLNYDNECAISISAEKITGTVEITVKARGVAAYIGRQDYPTLEAAFAAATSTDPSRPTVVQLCRNLTFGTEGDIASTIRVPTGKVVKLTSWTGGPYTISRKAANDGEGYFFSVYDDSTFILEDIVLDGKELATGGENYFVAVAGAELILEDGAVLKNNTSPAIRVGTGAYDNLVSAVTMNGGEIVGNSAGGINMLPNFSSQSGKTLRFTMNDGKIQENTRKDSGAGIYASNSYSASGCTTEVIIHGGEITGNQSTLSGSDTVKGGGGIFCDSKFFMDGGTIAGNFAGQVGGGIYLAGGISEARITGGTIQGNSANGMTDTNKGKGENLYINSIQNLVLSPAMDMDGIFLYLGARLLIPFELEHSIELEGAYQGNASMPGLPVARGTGGYTLTDADLARFAYKNHTYGFALDKTSNQIKLANPSYSVSYTLTGMEGKGSTPLPVSVEEGNALAVQFVATSDYKLPAAGVKVKVGDIELANTDYILQNYASGCSIYIAAAKITGAIEIIAVAQEKSHDAALTGLGYNYKAADGGYRGGVVENILEGGVYKYEVILPWDITSDFVYIDYKKSNTNASITADWWDDGGITLDENGEKMAELTVIAEDGTTTQDYVIHFVKAAYGISLSPEGDKTFSAAVEGYGEQEGHSVTVTNTGNQAIDKLTVALSGVNSDAFALSDTSIGSIAVDGSGGFSVKPQTGLAVGTYTAAVTVSGSNGITAAFNVSFTVTARTLDSIAVTTPPTKRIYMEGESFDAAGMVVTAAYSNQSTEEVTGYTVTPAGVLPVGTTSVTISYTEGEETRTTTQAITVQAKTLTSITVTTPPTKRIYMEGESFDAAGMVVTAAYSNQSTAVVTGYTVTPAGALTAGTTSVTISYTEGEETRTATQAITVQTPAPAQYVVTLRDGGTGASGSGSYEAGKTVAVYAGTRSGYSFNGWTGDVAFADKNSASTTFVMPEADVTVTANWKSSGGGNSGGGGGGSSSGGSSFSSGGTVSVPITTTTTADAENGGSVTTIQTTTTDSNGTTTTVTSQIIKDAAGNVTSSTTTVTTGNVTASGNQEDTTITVKPDASAINSAAGTAGATAEKPLGIMVAAPQETIVNELQKADVNSVNVNVILPKSVTDNPAVQTAGVTIPKAAVEAARQTGKGLLVTVREENGAINAVWALDGQTMRGAAGEATDLYLLVHTAPVRSADPAAGTVQSAVSAKGHDNGLVIAITASGTLLSNARLTIPAINQTGIAPGSMVILYRYDPAAGWLTTASGDSYLVDANGNVTINIQAGNRTGARELYVLLAVPAQGTPAAEPESGSGITYTIQKGDTLNQISRQYGCRVEELLALNPGLDIYNLQVGSNIAVPVR